MNWRIETKLYTGEKGFSVIDMWECEWRRLYKTTTKVKLHFRENVPYERSLTEHQLLEGKMKGNFHQQIPCDCKVIVNLRINSINFPAIFKSTLVRKKDIGDLTKTYPVEKGIIHQPRKMMLWSITLQDGSLYNPLPLFFLQLGVLFTKNTVSLSTLQTKVSAAFYSQHWTQEYNVTKI